MTEQQPNSVGSGPDRKADASVRVEQSHGSRIRESVFTDQVIETAHYHGWRTYHLRDRDSIHIVRGRGFPDLMMYRNDSKTGQTELLAAELKREYDRELEEVQEEWLGALGYHIPAFEWRPENWDEIESVLKDGPPSASGATLSPREHRWSSGQIPLNFGNVVTNLAETVEAREFGTGNRARLRRMDPNNPDTAVFWQLMARDGMPRNPDIRKWGLILHGIALMAHEAGLAHRRQLFVGKTLYEGDGKAMPLYSERRLATLLSARGPALYQLLARMFRMLANKKCAFNWREMAWFILNEGENEERAEQARIEIARAYYQAERRSTQASDD